MADPEFRAKMNKIAEEQIAGLPAGAREQALDEAREMMKLDDDQFA